MEALSKALCADCIAFMSTGRDDQGLRHGTCRLRPELRSIAESLSACRHFHVRIERADKVQAPKASKVARSPRSAAASPRPRVLRADLNKPVSGDTEGVIEMDRDGLKQVLRELLEEETLYGYPELAARWQGGNIEIKPADETMQSKDLPIDTLFHKVVMLRDRLRVLESKINSHDKLNDVDKVDLQGYISKCYGTLTTFNILFQDKDEHFRSK